MGGERLERDLLRVTCRGVGALAASRKSQEHWGKVSLGGVRPRERPLRM